MKKNFNFFNRWQLLSLAVLIGFAFMIVPVWAAQVGDVFEVEIATPDQTAPAGHYLSMGNGTEINIDTLFADENAMQWTISKPAQAIETFIFADVNAKKLIGFNDVVATMKSENQVLAAMIMLNQADTSPPTFKHLAAVYYANYPSFIGVGEFGVNPSFRLSVLKMPNSAQMTGATYCNG